jgi:hypothetical protein
MSLIWSETVKVRLAKLLKNLPQAHESDAERGDENWDERSQITSDGFSALGLHLI